MLSGEPAPFCVVADEQLSGRGTNGRSWSSHYGNLLISFAWSLPPSVGTPIDFMRNLSCAVAEALRGYCPDINVKAPNDLHVSGRKICGILCEPIGSPKSARCEWVIGVGLNVNANLNSFPAELRDKVTSLRELVGSPLVLRDVEKSVAEAILDFINQSVYANPVRK